MKSLLLMAISLGIVFVIMSIPRLKKWLDIRKKKETYEIKEAKVAKNNMAMAITRIIVTAILFINAMLTMAWKNPIPLDETTVGVVVSGLLSGLTILWSWWKNNNITKNALKAQEAKELMDARQSK